MGIITSGILGPISGKVGPVVGGSWKGIAYLRQLPASVANPQTAAQTAQRTKLSNIVAFAKQVLTTVIKPLNDRFASGQSGYNRFVSANIALFAAAIPSPAASLVISEGSLLDADVDTVTATDASTVVRCEWTDNSGTGNAQATDQAYCVWLNETTGAIIAQTANTDRDSELIVGAMDANSASGDVVRAYLAFRTANGFLASNTTTGTVTVA